jgi:glutamate/tyrosine decarboxylase-like PLP-dependent enzyme
MKARCKMDYLDLLGKGCIWLGGSMLIAVALYLARAWWLERKEREVRKSLAAIKQAEDEYYTGLHLSLLLHVNEMIRKVDRQ